jgi:FkbM family methyltransferase
MKAFVFFPYSYWPSFVIAYFFQKLGFKKIFQKYDTWLYSRKKMMPWLSKATCTNKTITVQDPDSSTRFLLRKVSSDIKVFEQVILHKEYEAVATYSRLLNFIPKTILDLGGNIGLTSVYLSQIYPSAAILVVEPDAANAAILRHNVALNKLSSRIKVVEGAVWSKEALLQTTRGFRDSEGWSVQVEESQGGDNSIKGYTVAQLMKLGDFPQIDLLKVDIEGAEKYLFESEESTAFLRFVKLLCIEIHEEACPASQITKWLDHYGFSYFVSGEHLIAKKNKIG